METKTDTLDQTRTDFIKWFESYKFTRNSEILCEEAIEKLGRFVKAQRVLLEPFFRGFDRNNDLRVSKNQMRRVLTMNSIVLREEEFEALLKRFCDDIGFKYREFLCEICRVDCAVKYKEIQEDCEENSNCESQEEEPQPKLKTSVEVIAKIVLQIIDKQLNFNEFLKDEKKGLINEKKFKDSLTDLKVDLDEDDFEILYKSFKSPCSGSINLREFKQVIRDILHQIELDKSAMLDPKNNFFTSENNFLNFVERTMATNSLQKLARNFEKIANLSMAFGDRKTVKRCELMNVLCGLRINDILSSRELDVLWKCFTDDLAQENSDFKCQEFLQTIAHVYDLGQ